MYSNDVCSWQFAEAVDFVLQMQRQPKLCALTAPCVLYISNHSSSADSVE